MKNITRKGRSSRTGKAPYLCCRTCQTRHIKCSGGRPSCHECITRGLDCGGYTSWDVSVNVASTGARSSHSPSTIPVILDNNTEAGPLSIYRVPSIPLLRWAGQHALRAFDYFRYHIRERYILRGYPTLWATSSISIGLQDPAVFYAVAALSTAEHALVDTVHASTLARPIDNQQWKSALQMYSKAIEFLRGPMQRAIQGVGPLEPIILSCLLFIVFEVTNGNHLNALRHARTGKSILAERLARQGTIQNISLSTSPGSELPRQVLAAKSNCESTLESSYGHLTHAIDADYSFTSLEAARVSLESLIEVGHGVRNQLLREAGDPAATMCMGSSSTSSRFCNQHTLSKTIPVDVALQTQLDETTNEFRSWARRFDPMFLSGEFVSQELFFLQVRFFYAAFTLAMCREPDERLTDRFRDQFVRTLESAERLCGSRLFPAEKTIEGPVAVDFMQMLGNVTGTSLAISENVPNSAHAGPWPQESSDNAVGVFEFGILHALFTIACECRTSSLRRRAARLLSESRRIEAVNNSRTLSTYAAFIIRLEEQQAAHLKGQLDGCAARISEFYADEVPEEARFVDVVTSPLAGKAGCFTLSCTRRTDGASGDFELLEYECCSKPVSRRLVRIDVFRPNGPTGMN